jgi:hypothetical protein
MIKAETVVVPLATWDKKNDNILTWYVCNEKLLKGVLSFSNLCLPQI